MRSEPDGSRNSQQGQCVAETDRTVGEKGNGVKEVGRGLI